MSTYLYEVAYMASRPERPNLKTCVRTTARGPGVKPESAEEAKILDAARKSLALEGFVVADPAKDFVSISRRFRVQP